MKVSHILIGIVCAMFAAGMVHMHTKRPSTKSTVPAHIATAFEQWKSTQNKAYSSPAENLHRLSIFYQNYIKISQHTEESYGLGLNLFADLTEEEFVNRFTGYRGEKKSSAPRATHVRSLNQGPKSVDWRQQGAVNPVKNQGQCGSCWAFSAIAAFESAVKIAGYPLFSFSEQQLVDCSAQEGNHGCNGGLMDNAFTYIQKTGGEETEANYPYRAIDEHCKADPSKFEKPQITGFTDVAKGNCGQLLDAIAKQPVSVAIAANAIQFYTHGVFSNKFCGTGLNHGVTAVGYGTDSSTEKDFWLVRNSWGASWGEQGYIRMDRNVMEKTGICGICLAASYPQVSSP